MAAKTSAAAPSACQGPEARPAARQLWEAPAALQPPHSEAQVRTSRISSRDLSCQSELRHSCCFRDAKRAFHRCRSKEFSSAKGCTYFCGNRIANPALTSAGGTVAAAAAPVGPGAGRRAAGARRGAARRRRRRMVPGAADKAPRLWRRRRGLVAGAAGALDRAAVACAAAVRRHARRPARVALGGVRPGVNLHGDHQSHSSVAVCRVSHSALQLP